MPPSVINLRETIPNKLAFETPSNSLDRVKERSNFYQNNNNNNTSNHHNHTSNVQLTTQAHNVNLTNSYRQNSFETEKV